MRKCPKCGTDLDYQGQAGWENRMFHLQRHAVAEAMKQTELLEQILALLSIQKTEPEVQP